MKTSPAPQSSSRPLSWRKKAIFAVLTVGSFFGVCELVLALLSVKPLAATADPFVGFSNYMPLFTPVSGETDTNILQTAPGKLVWFNEQQFSAQKPRGTRRVFCLGGSTTYGRPYNDKTSFSNWLRQLLPLVDESQRWEIINAGGVSYASYRVAALMQELVQYEPDLFIVYCGHNEFLERRTYEHLLSQPTALLSTAGLLSRTRMWTVAKQAYDRLTPVAEQDDSASQTLLPAEVDERMNHTIGPADYHRDPGGRAAILQHYKYNLQRMIRIAATVDAQVLFVVPVSNEKDCSPFKSEYGRDIPLALQQDCEQAYEQALQEIENEQFDQAERRLKDILAADPELAKAAFQLGRLEFVRGQFQPAFQHFRQALDQDVCPLRIPTEFGQALRQVAREAQVPLLDFEARLRAQCQADYAHTVLGSEYFLDHVHLTIDAHRQLAAWLIESMQANGILPGPTLSETQIASVADQVRLDPREQGVALRNLAKVLHWAGKFTEAEPHARHALELLPDDPESQLVLADCLWNTGRREEALQGCELLLAGNPFYARGYQYYGDRLLTMEEYAQAREYLELAVAGLDEGSPHRIRAHYSLGLAHLGLNDFAAAEEHLSVCLTSSRDEPNVWFHLAEAKAGLGQAEAAIELYQRVLQAIPEDAEALIHLGVLHLQQAQYAQAVEMLEAALVLEPTNARAQASLEAARQLAATSS